MSWFISEWAVWLMMFSAAAERFFALRLAGDHGAKPMSVGRFGSTRVQLSAIIAVAMPFVVVCR